VAPRAVTTVPEITRMIARIQEWRDGHGKPGGRAEAARRLDEADALRTLLSQRRQPVRHCREGATATETGRNMRTLALAVLAVALPLSVARSEFQTGNDLWTLCHQKGPGCVAYIEGVADVLMPIWAKGGDFSGWRGCLPKETIGGQVKDVFIKFLREHPEKRHFTASSLVSWALAEAFPCGSR
jgi:hypothetical protein